LICLASYDAQAKRYHPEVSKQKRLALIQKMAADALPLFQNQLKVRNHHFIPLASD